MWRVYKSHHERVWIADGVVMKDAAIEGLYKRTDEGAHGTYLMRIQELSSRYVGWFYEWAWGTQGTQLQTRPISAPLEWLKVGSDHDTKALSIIDDESIQQGWPTWPPPVRHRMKSVLHPKGKNRNAVAARCAYLGAFTGNPSACLAFAAQRRRSEAAKAAASKPPTAILGPTVAGSRGEDAPK
jgi:hypothetical protein